MVTQDRMKDFIGLIVCFGIAAFVVIFGLHMIMSEVTH